MLDAMTLPDDTLSRDDRRYAQVLARDASQDGLFWYGVMTTGVYCRPGCASRAPKRQNVRFYASPAEAQADGLRACKRCRPDAAVSRAHHIAAVTRACRLLEASETEPNLDALAAEAHLSPFHFHRLFKEITGLTPKQFAQSHRRVRVQEALQREASVTEAVYAAGFNSSGRFYEAADGMLGMSPTRFRQGGDGLTIRYTVAPCWLGLMLVAATERGLCCLILGDEADALIADLHARFPKAQIVPADAGFADTIAVVARFIETPAVGLSLPLDIQGTAFQQRVWQALRAIPPGQTASYSEIAAAIGQPKAARAVAGACAANPIAVAVPCHRIIRDGGAVSGYRWGVERKKKLLAREAGE
ncbi:bifunctional DNA-binding transcriptional regulator/O6-methylguanine-DNA methyltransferase Ada [Elstera cyanobacteriorum]|uniref:bifunctional DNA-binding transcriptional regulator/O6-methylguanine-DNA methyltransferase Ada n=1 Tax=Elstera cyanobacteriorum TaxID=2022747 RepID=UPI00235543F4|nr:bifunctional DNA-binding transcriptional regulator/O6-methylguanine-DNA methyltransferase Ada [Elstera cyanobacteriorum]MCK6441351.1 bifunctional DNA-binding transcriptional regulator/O6-methylguanine-DNA methyltransferase Ada [Elstera cyanobacteriorum]